MRLSGITDPAKRSIGTAGTAGRSPRSRVGSRPRESTTCGRNDPTAGEWSARLIRSKARRLCRYHGFCPTDFEDVIKARSEFKSRELTKGHAEAKKSRDIAQSPEAIRKKLEGKTSTAGQSTFLAKDLSLQATTDLEKNKIAQSPEAIRKKLELRKAKSSGKAQFGTKDLSDPKS